jgi:hypothetical protein
MRFDIGVRRYRDYDWLHGFVVRHFQDVKTLAYPLWIFFIFPFLVANEVMESRNPMVGVASEKPIINWRIGFVTSFGSLVVIDMVVELLVILKSCLMAVSFVDDRNHGDGSPSWMFQSSEKPGTLKACACFTRILDFILASWMQCIRGDRRGLFEIHTLS